MITKTIGIVCDNYKLDTYKKELERHQLTYRVTDFTKDTSTIKVVVYANQVQNLKKMCERLELGFKNQKK